MNKTIAMLGMLTLMAGCVGTKVTVLDPFDERTDGDMFSYTIATEDDVPQKALDIFIKRLESGLAHRKRLATAGNENIRMEIRFTNYYMRHGAARALVGIFAGTDSIVTEVRLWDAETGEILADYNVESSNPTATGTSFHLIRQHADKVVSYALSQKR